MILILQKNVQANALSKLLTRCQAEGIFAQLFLVRDQYRLVMPYGVKIEHDLSQWVEADIVNEIRVPQENRILTTKHFAEETVICLGSRQIGGNHFNIIAGPCSVESLSQIFDIAALIKEHGGHVLRGGAFKPRTSPYDFQGLGVVGLDYLKQAAQAFDLLSITEVMDVRDVDLVASKIDILQIGARNMQNFSLLKEVGKTQKPVLLKRGLAATYEEFLSSAEYIMAQGNINVILCERGIRSFEPRTRNCLDISAIPILKDLSHLPVIVDPSHALGIRQFVPQASYAAMAVGADGVMIEVHTTPDQSISDAKQTICPETFAGIVKKLGEMAPLFSKDIS